ncbi:Gamma-glutamyltranspeptidase 1 [Hypsibius exemplaris]|uniref:Gamma-glutamyltranspeptidase 1 n=1 Tax=Hypsibius exemplaris TaxID=2072580 RepID=A0A1W0X7R5_HYPEX|nr:Gamma-glutamyltranspeptidase 1 [Hypsibius exemplaris]
MTGLSHQWASWVELSSLICLTFCLIWTKQSFAATSLSFFHQQTSDPFNGTSFSSTPPPSPSVLAKYNLQSVAADSAHCSSVGNQILLKDGSAADAAIATALCGGLFHSQSCGLGGGFFMVFYNRSSKKATALDAREVAPGAATELMYVTNKNYSSLLGWTAIGVPGELAGYWEAFKRFGSGKVSWSELLEPAIALAREGVTVDAALAGAIAENAHLIRSGFDEGLSSLFMKNATSGELYAEGDRIKYPVLAETLQMIAEDKAGVDEFYRGKIAHQLVDDIQRGGGLMTLADVSNYKVTVSDALHTQLLDGTNLYGMPPPGGSAILQFILNIMDNYQYNNSSWNAMTNDDKILLYQRFVEAMKFAYARRTKLGDPAFEPSVDELVESLKSHELAHQTKELIKETHTSNDPAYYGVKVLSPVGQVGTSHMSILDKDGNAVALTTTINTLFGSKRVSKSTGIILNNEMDDFTTNPTASNFFGLPPSQQNRIAPGKRPQSSMSPTVVTDSNGDVRIVVGASGGSRIISGVANVLLRVLYLGQTIKEAIDAPRLHHQLFPMVLEYERNFSRTEIEALQIKGHKVVQATEGFSAVIQGVVRLSDGTIHANCDFRKGGSPAGL